MRYYLRLSKMKLLEMMTTCFLKMSNPYLIVKVRFDLYFLLYVDNTVNDDVPFINYTTFM